MKYIILLSTFISVIFSDINFSGDARIRPRLDIIDKGVDSSSMDLYYSYRGRLNIDADIGGGWFFNAKLGTNDVAGMTKMGDDNTKYTYREEEGKSDYYLPGDEPGDLNSSRPQVSFINLYYGIKKENFGFWGGAIPLKYSSSLDIHFYPDKVIDIPWLLYNNGSTVGFAGYISKLNWFISIDGNKKEIEKYVVEDTRIEEKNMDPFTIGLDIPFKWNDFLDVHPRLIFSIDNSDQPWPITGGFDFSLRSFFGIKPQLSYYFSTQFLDEKTKYKATHMRLKFDREFGPGKLTFWGDIGTHIDESKEENTNTDYMYIWLDYKCQLFKSDFGSISLKPTIRVLNKKTLESEYSRMKFELTTEIKFK